VEQNRNHIDGEHEFPMRPYSLKELAAIYQCSRKTIYSWVRDLDAEIGPRIGHFYNPRQVRLIVASLGPPPSQGDGRYSVPVSSGERNLSLRPPSNRVNAGKHHDQAPEKRNSA
jgi:hypothetical protein